MRCLVESFVPLLSVAFAASLASRYARVVARKAANWVGVTVSFSLAVRVIFTSQA
jgi:hypothetical protein